jgi:hypothetical protein
MKILSVCKKNKNKYLSVFASRRKEWLLLKNRLQNSFNTFSEALWTKSHEKSNKQSVIKYKIPYCKLTKGN